MAKLYDEITGALREFIQKQHMYFVATAPLSDQGRVNLSPKGLDTFRILSEHRVAYLDLTGSGSETSAHVMENGRITFMFCAFEGYPDIVRLYGKGRVVLPDDPEWGDLIAHFEQGYSGIRQIIVAEIDRVSTSCGYGVPLYEYVDQRDQMMRWAEAKGDSGLEQYRSEKNMQSIDGLPTPLSKQKSKASHPNNAL